VLAGYPQRGIRRIHKAIERGRAIKDQLGYAISVAFSNSISWTLRDFEAMRNEIDLIVAHLAAYELREGTGWARLWAAALKAANGDPSEALSEWKAAQFDLESVGSFLLARGSSHLAAALYREASSEAETLRFIDSCLEQLSQSWANLPEAELCRMKGEILGDASPYNVAESELWLRRAIETSKRQGARWYELRAATSLARLLDRQGKRDEARAMLADNYGWFTDGFDLPDLMEAQSLLDELGT
jgi:hypothetical protein